MLYERVYHRIRTPRFSGWGIPLLGGVSLILMGVLIILVPEILAAFFAVLFFLAGIGLISLALTIRKSEDWFDRNTTNYYW